MLARRLHRLYRFRFVYGLWSVVCGLAPRRFEIRRVAALDAPDDLVFPTLGRRHELMRHLPAHGPGIGVARQHRNPAPRKDPLVGVVHRLIAAGEPCRIHIEAVGVLHQELFRPDDAEARTGLIAELRLNLIDRHRQLFIRLDFLQELGHHLLMCRPQHHCLAGPVLELDQDLAQDLVPAGGLPQLGRLEHRHQQLLRAGAVHLLPDDRGRLLQRAQSERQIGVRPGAETADEPGAHHQLMADGVGVLRVLAEGGQEVV